MRASAIPLRLVMLISFLLGIVPTAFAIPATTISFSLNDIDISESDGYDLLNIEGCHLAGEPGQPYLPCKAVNFVIPRGRGVARVRVEVEGKERIPGNYYIYPAQPPKPTGDGYGDDDFVDPDVDIYGSTEPFPGVVVEEGRTAMAWGWKTYQVTVWPLEYIPARREIWFNETVRISLELSPSTEDEQEILARTREQQEDWTKELEQAMVNPEDVRPLAPNVLSPITGPRRWVLILPGRPEREGRDTWIDTFQPLITHRQNQGLETEVVYLRDITDASGEAAVQDIRLYLRDQHENHGAQWVCLVGDDEMIPWTYRNPMPYPPHWDFNTRIPNDWCYCDLDGQWNEGMDWAPEMWAGRVPCITKTEGENFVQKVLAYEQNPSNEEDYDYLSRVFYESADEMTDSATCEQVMTHQHPSLHDTLFAEEPSGSHPDPIFPWAWQVVNEINSTGYNYVVVHCHGRRSTYATMSYGYSPAKDLFGLTEIEDLTNEDYYYFWYSIACCNAHIDSTSYRTIAEGATCIYANRCAIAFAGNTRFGYLIPSTNLNCHAWDQLFPGLMAPYCFNHVGAVEARSKLRGYVQADVSNSVLFSHNLFGDPATPIWTPDYMPGSQKPIAAGDLAVLPAVTYLQCAPVPIRERGSLHFRLRRRSPIVIGIYDLLGRRIWDHMEDSMAPGEIVRPLDCSDMPAGSYLVQLEAGTERARTRIVVVR